MNREEIEREIDLMPSRSVEMKVLDKDLHTFGLPKYESDKSAGMDLRAMFPEEELTIPPGQVVLIPTGLAIHIDKATQAIHILPRSGLGHKRGLVLGNLVGLIDADYQDQLMVSFWNRGSEAQTIKRGERIAQMVLMPIIRFDLVEVEEFADTGRGGGWGHTGTN